MKRPANALILGLAAALLSSNTRAALALPANQATAVDLSQFVVPPDAIGDGWTIVSQHVDTTGLGDGFKPVPAVAGFSVSYRQPDSDVGAGIDMYRFPNHAGAVASLSDPRYYWGNGSGVSLVTLSGLGDDKSFREYGIGISANSGITFVDGPIVVYVRAAGGRTSNIDTDGVDAICDSLAAAEDALLQAASPTPAAQAPATASSGGVPMSGIAASLAALPQLSSLLKFGRAVLVPPAGLEPFASSSIPTSDAASGLAEGGADIVCGETPAKLPRRFRLSHFATAVDRPEPERCLDRRYTDPGKFTGSQATGER